MNSTQLHIIACSPGRGLLESVDPRTDSQRRNRKRRETNQIVSRAAREEVAAVYPRFSPSSEHVANRAGFTRAAVVDIKISQFER